MIKRACATCKKPRWAQTYPTKKGYGSTPKTQICKPCRHKAGERDTPRKPRPKRVKKPKVTQASGKKKKA